MSRFDAIVRRLVPSVPALSRNRLLMAPLDLLDRVISLPFAEARKLPPNRLRIRVGVGNRILFNQFQHRHGEAYIENRRYPEAAVAYSKAFLESACARAGFQQIDLRYARGQSLLRARKGNA